MQTVPFPLMEDYLNAWESVHLPRREGYEILMVKHPVEEVLRAAYLSRREIELSRGQLWRAKEMAATLRQCLERPYAVFLGIREVDGSVEDVEDDTRFKNGLCYVANHCVRYVRKLMPNGDVGVKEIAPAGEVFCAFINTERTILHWEWIPSSPDHRRLPEDFKHRFRKRLV